jgi:hypothetical protein
MPCANCADEFRALELDTPSMAYWRYRAAAQGRSWVFGSFREHGVMSCN